MLSFIDTGDDIIAIKVSHKITGADLDAVMDRLDRAMAAAEASGGKVHIFVETESIDSIELASLPSYASRAMPLFGKLSRFGRVAVVADQAWVRFGTRLESMILPFMSYRVFEPQQRDEALAWVLGSGS